MCKRQDTIKELEERVEKGVTEKKKITFEPGAPEFSGPSGCSYSGNREVKQNENYQN